MDMTRRQFTLALAAATYLRPSLFEPLSPSGVPRGVVPGRVTWAHDPAAVTWDGTGSWWTDAHNDQSVIDRMVSRSICGLTNQKSDAQAWASIFQYFNRTHRRGKAGYRVGEKIAIKANLNNTTDHGTIERRNRRSPSSIPAGSSRAISTTRFTMNFPVSRLWTISEETDG